MAHRWNAEIPGWLKGYGTGIFPLGISTRPKISSEIVVYFTKLINAVQIRQAQLIKHQRRASDVVEGTDLMNRGHNVLGIGFLLFLDIAGMHGWCYTLNCCAAKKPLDKSLSFGFQYPFIKTSTE
jgi:hypothetical protein